jgi:hypothetical protein
MPTMSVSACTSLLRTCSVAEKPICVLLQDVRIELDTDTKLEVTMRLQHITAINAEARGVRLGFEFKRVGGDSLRALQRFIDLTQKRGKLMAIS